MAKTALVVDDIAFVRRTITDILSSAKYHVVAEAKDGQEALECYAKYRPDVVIMDVVMPRMSGIEAARKLIKMDSDARIIMVSAMEQEHIVIDAIHSGARDYIQKPFKAEELLRTLEHIVVGRSNKRAG